MSTPSAPPPGSEAAGADAAGSDSAERIAGVILETPLPQLDRLLDYRVPSGMDGVRPGVRVAVPLRSAGRIAQGFVVEVSEPGAAASYPGPLSAIEQLVSPVPVLRPEVWALARAASHRAAGSAADVLRLAVPKRQVRVERAWLAAGTPEPVVCEIPSITSAAREDAEDLLGSHRRVAVTASAGVVELGGEPGTWVGRWAVLLAELAALALARGESAILAVPDWRDVEQLDAAARRIAPADAVLRWDAKQPTSARYRALLDATTGPRIIVGTRSAVYAPAERLGLLAVWNDGDPLLGEPLAPYVHTRDAALIRQSQQGCALVFAGHSRSTEVQRLVELGFLTEFVPPAVPRARVVPTLALVGADRPAEQARIPSSAWSMARAALANGPVLVQVARPGYSPGLVCADCGEPATCCKDHGPLSVARRGAVPRCRWCGAAEPAWRCGACNGESLRPTGSGSVRTADELGRAFPGVPVVVADGERSVERVPTSPSLVVATRGAEPLADGGYRAVLLLDGERMIAAEQLRIAEHCLRWWMDAAALAAPDAEVALVGVGGELAAALLHWRPELLAASQLRGRRELRFPPAVRVATVTGTPPAVEALLAVVVSASVPGLDVLGPTISDSGSRAIIRFDYASGERVAGILREEAVRAARRARPPAVPGTPRRRAPLPLRIRMDDPTPFDE